MLSIVTEISDWLDVRKKHANQQVGFVPTMGHLHDGHLSLCSRSKNENKITVLSIFVNPTQFNDSEDFQLYPRTIENDIKLLELSGVDYLFCPTEISIYPDNYQFQVCENEISHILEGEFRPGHFNGMMTVVLKLINLIQPDRAYFGEKDFQQLLLIQEMTKALFLPVEIIPCETIRDENGLALSSRNSRLTPNQKLLATSFAKLLQSNLPLSEIENKLKKLGLTIDYISEKWGRRLGAVWVDDIRLIDNVPV